jgi:hypothetical protein
VKPLCDLALFVISLAIGLILAPVPASAQTKDPIINMPNDTAWYGSGPARNGCFPAPVKGCIVEVEARDCFAQGDGTTCREIFISLEAGTPTGEAGKKICANVADTGKSNWIEENGDMHPIDFSGTLCETKGIDEVYIHGNYRLDKAGSLPNGGIFSVITAQIKPGIAVVNGKGTSLP